MFANTYSTLDVSLNDLRMQVRFFEYALGAEDIATKSNRTPMNTSTPFCRR
jgi:hypothetical protein